MPSPFSKNPEKEIAVVEVVEAKANDEDDVGETEPKKRKLSGAPEKTAQDDTAEQALNDEQQALKVTNMAKKASRVPVPDEDVESMEDEGSIVEGMQEEGVLKELFGDDDWIEHDEQDLSAVPCPILGVVHPPSGEEFCLGCGMCRAEALQQS